MLIVARYNEDPKWVLELNIPYIIYNKGNHIDNYDNVISIENIGRESETYLRFILTQYENLPEVLILSQGNPFDHCKDFINRLSSYNEIKDITYLADWIVEEDLEGRPYAYGYGMVDMLKKLNIPLTIDKFIFPAGAQYIVPKSFILNKSKKWWEHCYKEHNNNNLSPWIFERIFPLIFSYNEI